MTYYEKYLINGVVFEIKQSNYRAYYLLFADGVEKYKHELLHRVQTKLLNNFKD
jgi:hypothetical protein